MQVKRGWVFLTRKDHVRYFSKDGNLIIAEPERWYRITSSWKSIQMDTYQHVSRRNSKLGYVPSIFITVQDIYARCIYKQSIRASDRVVGNDVRLPPVFKQGFICDCDIQFGSWQGVAKGPAHLMTLVLLHVIDDFKPDVLLPAEQDRQTDVFRYEQRRNHCRMEFEHFLSVLWILMLGRFCLKGSLMKEDLGLVWFDPRVRYNSMG